MSGRRRSVVDLTHGGGRQALYVASLHRNFTLEERSDALRQAVRWMS